MTTVSSLRTSAIDRREIVTPEGIPLGLRLADAGERATAFFVDCLFIFAILVGVSTIAHYGGGASSNWIQAFIQLLAFLLVNFWFIFFEVRWQGATPGKRIIGLRVIDSRGRPLESPAIIARNLIRDLEVWIPVQIIANPDQIWPGSEGLVRLVAMGWVFVFMLLPLLNKDRLRVGDLVGGTIVVLAPKTVLLPDLGAAGEHRQGRGATYQFTEEQLDVYGIYELQVLEDVLRGKDGGDRENTMFQVAEKIKAKIGWDRNQWYVEDERFLEDFYAAMRDRLERKMLYGKRREDKYSKE